MSVLQCSPVSGRVTARLLALGLMLGLPLIGCPDSTTNDGGDCPTAGEPCGCDGGAGRLICLVGDGGAACECGADDAEPDGPSDRGCVASGSEVCNGQDDDCDGVSDEMPGVCQQAGTCFAGRRVCAAAPTPNGGAIVCRDGAGIDRPISGDEQCSGSDDDCDGMVDEGFDVMVDSLNCGGCGRDCTAPFGLPLQGATFACQAGTCAVEACGPGREDSDGRADNGCECAIDEPDRPDPLLRDSDCDDRVDEDVEAELTVFVDPAGRPGASGEADDPVPTLGAALAIAEATGRRDVLLAIGRYDLHPGLPDDDPQRQIGLEVPDGMRLRGGFARDAEGWHRPRRGENRSIVSGASPVLSIRRLSRPTVIEAIDIVAARGVDGQMVDGRGISGTDSVAVLAEDVGEHLLIANCLIESEDAGRGFRGVAGAEGRVGGHGGRPGLLEAQADCPHRPGSLRCGGLRGITRRCDPLITVPVGGDGGHAESAGGPGAATTGIEPALGGASGQPGLDGLAGAAGRSGASGGREGRIVDGRWVPDRGADGESGRPGNGGGGGGGSRVYGGGGGGGGGCPGQAGVAAEGGQGSFAVVVRGGRVWFVDSPDGERPGRLEVQARRGGPGGIGGRGGEGGLGGQGAPGAPEEGPCPGCTPGGEGGQGGRGGCGGHGGPGAGGPAFAVLRLPPVGGRINDSRVGFLEPIGDPLDPARRRAVADAAAAVEIYLGVAGGGAGGLPAGGPACPATTGEASVGVASAVGCCITDEAGRCAPLGPCAP